MNKPEVKIVKLTVMRVVAFTKVSESPELEAFNALSKWAKANGYGDMEKYPVFGYERPDLYQGSKRAHTFWLNVPKSFKGEAADEVIDVPGSTYAVTTCATKGDPFGAIPKAWERLFCVDNLPAELLPKFLELSVLAGGEIHRVALGMDLRDRHFLDRYRKACTEVERLGLRPEVFYLEASDEVLVRRFSETRRRDPLAEGRSISQGIREDRRLFEELKGPADRVIDTSEMTVHDLKKAMWNYFKQGPDEQTLQVDLLSFGYRYGIPHEADLLLDVRFLPNPYFVPALKSHVGTEAVVQEFVLGTEEAREFLRRFVDLLELLLPQFEREGNTSLTTRIVATLEHVVSSAGVSERCARIP